MCNFFLAARFPLMLMTCCNPLDLGASMNCIYVLFVFETSMIGDKSLEAVSTEESWNWLEQSQKIMSGSLEVGAGAGMKLHEIARTTSHTMITEQIPVQPMITMSCICAAVLILLTSGELKEAQEALDLQRKTAAEALELQQQEARLVQCGIMWQNLGSDQGSEMVFQCIS